MSGWVFETLAVELETDSFHSEGQMADDHLKISVTASRAYFVKQHLRELLILYV